MSYLRTFFRRAAAPLSAMLAGVFLAACATEVSPVTGQRRAYGLSWNQELQIGQQHDAQLQEQLGVYEDPDLDAYVDAVGQRVLAVSDMRRESTPEQYQQAEFTFRVMNSPAINAFALPGGYIYVTRGMLAHLQNEAQLAVVLGHEIAHVAARHASQQALRGQLGQLGVIAGAILGQQVLGGSAAENIMQLGGGAFQALMLSYSREAERESDRLGVEYASLAGYSAAEGAWLFRTLQRVAERERGAAVPNWQSTHPDPGQRQLNIVEMAAKWSQVTDSTEVGQEAFYAAIDGMVLGDDPREGYVENGLFLHPELHFQFPVPQGWQVRNERALVAMLEPQGRAALVLQAVPFRTAREAAAQLANSQGVRVINSGQTRVGEFNAFRLIAQGASQQGPVGIDAVFIEDSDRVYAFIGYAPGQIFSSVQPVFSRVVSGYQRLTDPTALAAQPNRLRIVTANRAAPFRTFVPGELRYGLTAEELAIINQLELDDVVEPGQRLKLPE
jgi:predicted Zn-dependent protease